MASSLWWLKTREVFGGACRTAKRSAMIIDDVSVAVIVGSAQVVGKKSTVFDVYNALLSLM